MSKRNSYLKEYICGNWKYSILFLLCYMALGCVQAGTLTLTPVDFLFLITKGFSYQNFQVVEFLYYIFFYIFPLFWINVFLENEKKDRNTAAKFRYGSVQRWNFITLKECMVYVLRYYCQYLLCMLFVDAFLVMVHYNRISGYFFGIQEQYGIHTEMIYLGFVVAILWRLVELLLLLEIDLWIYQRFGNTLAAFLGTFAVYLLEAVLSRWNILVAGLSALYGVLEMFSRDQIIIFTANILAGVILVILLFVIQLKRAGKLRNIRLKQNGGEPSCSRNGG